MQLRYSYRISPAPAQRQALARAFGCARVVFNDGLRLRQDTRAAGLACIPDGELLRLVTTMAKRTPERAWLGEVSAVVLQQAVADLNAAYRNFFDSLAGTRKGRRMRPPRFRSKKGRQSIRFTRNARFRVLPNGRLLLPKVGEVRVRWSRPARNVLAAGRAENRNACGALVRPGATPARRREAGTHRGGQPAAAGIPVL